MQMSLQRINKSDSQKERTTEKEKTDKHLVSSNKNQQ